MDRENIQSNWLSEYRKNITSQNGEDGVIERIFDIVGTENKWCVEFGAGSGKKGNNTWNLIMNRGWSAVLLEAERVLFRDLVKCYREHLEVVCLNSVVSFKGKNSLDNLLKKTNIPIDFDFLSIDIDGFDYQVWQALSFYHPRVVMIEFNSNIPKDIEFIQPKDTKVPAGSSLTSMVKLASIKGYKLVYVYGVNAVFVKKELFYLFGIDNSSVENFSDDFVFDKKHSPNSFFQLYDGSIVLYGTERMRMLCYRKKIKDTPVWILENGHLFPVKFTRDYKIFRFIKNLIKKTSLYSWVYPAVKVILGRMDFWRKKKIKTGKEEIEL